MMSISPQMAEDIGEKTKMTDGIMPYADNWEHIKAELAYLELIVKAHLARMKALSSEDGSESLHGLYLSEADVYRLLEAFKDEKGEVEELLKQAGKLRTTISKKRIKSEEAGIRLRLPLLARLFGLDDVEERLLMVCLAPELDQRYEKFFAYLNDDLTRRGPTSHLALALALDQSMDLVQGRGYLAESSRLFRAQLLQFANNGHAAMGRMAQVLCIDERIANFLVEVDGLPGKVERFAQLSFCIDALDDDLVLRLVEVVRENLDHPNGERLVVHLVGPKGVGKRALAEAVCAHLDTLLLEIDLGEFTSSGDAFESELRLAVRETLLQPAALYLENYDSLQPAQRKNEDGDEGTISQRMKRLGDVTCAVTDFSWLTFLSSMKGFEIAGHWGNHTFLHVPFAMPDASERAVLWLETLSALDVRLTDSEVDALAGQFRFTRGQIETALVMAREGMRLKPADQRQITFSDVSRACRQQSGPAMEGLAHHIESLYDWDDIVLPQRTLTQLHEICAEVRHRRLVYGEWGFGKKIARGKALSALFSGPSGTGKTMAAEIIAGELELDLYRIDLASVVSKYIGETEKNLSRIFTAAERSNAVLFFDEADALFGKRSEVKDAHDRYANIEISYLLQRMETYEGVVILATNLKKNMDEAFMRRLHFMVEFPFPDTAQRRIIWQGHFPEQAPRSTDIDFDVLAENLVLAGGNIRNVVLHAAFLAAADQEHINMSHLMRAAKREYDKIGRLASEVDFGAYWELVRGKAR